ncbi:MAG: TOBE domain-containing protein [Kiritimatiellia bacterium]
MTLSLRPETLRFDDPPAGAVNTFSSIVHGTVYLGEVAQHQVNLATIASTDAGAFLQLKAFELNPKIVARDDARQQARVWFSPDDVILLAR